MAVPDAQFAGQVLVRDARPDEYDEVSAIIVAAYGEYAAAIPSEHWEPYIRSSADVRSRLAETELIVAELDGKLVGTVTFYPDGQRSRGEEWPRGWSGLRLLGVPPEARGRGVARALMEESIRRARARGSTTLGLHTTERMQIARSLYERMGFVPVPEFDFRPNSGTVALAYRLDL